MMRSASRRASPERGSRDARWIRTLVEKIQYGGGFDQRVAVSLHQRGHPAQGIELANQLEVLADGPIAVLERHAQEIHADGDSPHERRIEHADENHTRSLLMTTPNRQPRSLQASANCASIRAASPRLMYCKCMVGPVSTSIPRFNTLPAARMPALC